MLLFADVFICYSRLTGTGLSHVPYDIYRGRYLPRPTDGPAYSAATYLWLRSAINIRNDMKRDVFPSGHARNDAVAPRAVSYRPSRQSKRRGATRPDALSFPRRPPGVDTDCTLVRDANVEEDRSLIALTIS